MIAAAGSLPERAWLTDLFSKETLNAEDRAALLAGRTAGASKKGRIVCACFSVDDIEIRKSIAAGAQDEAAIGAATRAGANCGSCKTELRRMLSDAIAAPKPEIKPEPAKDARHAA